MGKTGSGFAGLLLWFRKTAEALQLRSEKTGADVEHLLDLHRMLETGEGGKALLIERLFEEIEAIRWQQSEQDLKLDRLLMQQQAMIEALNLPIASAR